MCSFSLFCAGVFFVTQEPIDWHILKKKHFPSERLDPEYTPLPLVSILPFYHRKNALFVDVREKQYYDYGHIEGAIHLPPESLENLPEDTLAKLWAAPQIILYCNGTATEGVSAAVAHKLSQKGIDALFVYPAGWPEWRTLRLPMTMSDAMKKDIEQEWNPRKNREEKQ